MTHRDAERDCGGKKWQKNYRRYKVWQTVKQITEITCFPFFRVLVSFSAELQPLRSNQRASSLLPRLIFLLCFTCKTRCCRPLERDEKKEEKNGECTGETKMRAGDGVAHVAIWVFPASSSRFGTESVLFFFFFFLPLSLSLSHSHAMSVLRTHALFIAAFINNLIEKKGKESHPNIIGPNGTDRVP